MTEQRPSNQQFYRVAETIRSESECKCPACVQWTIVYSDPEETEIGTSFQGDAGKEAAEDICDLMNMAYDAGKEAETDNAEEAKLVAFFRSAEGDQFGRDGDYDNLSPAETAIRAMRELKLRKRK